MKINNKNNNK